MKHELLEEINPHEDSLRFYFLGQDASQRVEHHGAKPTVDFEDALII
jgi:CRISPR-associated protein Cas2